MVLVLVLVGLILVLVLTHPVLVNITGPTFTRPQKVFEFLQVLRAPVAEVGEYVPARAYPWLHHCVVEWCLIGNTPVVSSAVECRPVSAPVSAAVEDAMM